VYVFVCAFPVFVSVSPDGGHFTPSPCIIVPRFFYSPICGCQFTPYPHRILLILLIRHALTAPSFNCARVFSSQSDVFSGEYAISTEVQVGTSLQSLLSRSTHRAVFSEARRLFSAVLFFLTVFFSFFRCFRTFSLAVLHSGPLLLAPALSFKSPFYLFSFPQSPRQFDTVRTLHLVLLCSMQRLGVTLGSVLLLFPTFRILLLPCNSRYASAAFDTLHTCFSTTLAM